MAGTHCLSFGINETASSEVGGPCIGLILGDTLSLGFCFLFSCGSCFYPPSQQTREREHCAKAKIYPSNAGFAFCKRFCFFSHLLEHLVPNYSNEEKSFPGVGNMHFAYRLFSL